MCPTFADGLQHMVKPGHTLIIEEPESHIDAATQRNLARAIAMLVNGGVNVLLTTHSAYFVSQLNNLLLLSELSTNSRSGRGYKGGEVLAADSVGAYQFNPSDDGTHVETLDVTAEGGIPMDAFTDVHGDLYNEAIRLEHAR